MFNSLWKQVALPETTGRFQFTVERSQGTPLRFNGTLLRESTGADVSGFTPGEAHHGIRVYQIDTGGFAVVIEFHVDATTVEVDGEIVGSLDEMDDFFCIYAADHFHSLSLPTDGVTGQDKNLEQRVVSRYDRQVAELLIQLGGKPPVGAPIAGVERHRPIRIPNAG